MKRDQNTSAEYRLIKEVINIPFVDLIAGKVIRFNSLPTFFEFIINCIKLPIGFFHSVFTLIKYKPSVIVSFGGYEAIPIVFAARLFCIPSVTHEQTVVSGQANKIVAYFADRIFVSWKETLASFPSNKVVLTGNPLRKEVLSKTTDKYKLNKKLQTIYITGGNQGAHIINITVKAIISNLLDKYNVIHQTGTTTVTGDFKEMKKLSEDLNKSKNGVYIVQGDIFDQSIGEVFSKADLLISRSGANTLTEILALGKMSILIPIPWSINNEQLKNAQMVEKVGLAKVIEEKNLTPDLLLSEINKTFDFVNAGKSFKKNRLHETQAQGKEMVNFKASEKIVDELLKLIQ